MKLVSTSAPGKLMISGEYAVLDGAYAVVAAASARVSVRWVERASRDLPDEAAATRKLAEAELGRIDRALELDATELRRGDRKLGLGSSAAASAAVAGALLASHGHNLADPSVQRRALDLALRGHKAIAPQGSGADVAAATLGGFVHFRLEDGKLAEAERVALPVRLKLAVIWTGQEARTSTFLSAVRKFESERPSEFRALRERLFEQAALFEVALTGVDALACVAAAREYGLAMGALGAAAGIPIVTPELERIAQLAHEFGGSAKPSGAGGGDVAIAFFADREGKVEFKSACEAARFEVLDLELGVEGLRAE